MNQFQYCDYIDDVNERFNKLSKAHDDVLRSISINGEREKDLITLGNLESRMEAITLALNSELQKTLVKAGYKHNDR